MHVRKHRRQDLERERTKTLERLEAEDPEAANKLREQYEQKRAELRLMKQHRARRRWAQVAARFGGKDAQKAINAQFSDAKDQKDLLDKLARRRGSDSEGSTTSDSGSEFDDEDDHDRKLCCRSFEVYEPDSSRRCP